MIKKNDRVRHKDPEIDKIRGVMTVLEIKNNIALCGYLDYIKISEGFFNYSITELKNVSE